MRWSGLSLSVSVTMYTVSVSFEKRKILNKGHGCRCVLLTNEPVTYVMKGSEPGRSGALVLCLHSHVDRPDEAGHVPKRPACSSARTPSTM
eukprot:scaffold53635_cov75-Phaeocystis_antarctica.AAC.2